MLGAKLHGFRRGDPTNHLPGADRDPLSWKSQSVRDKLGKSRKLASAAYKEHRLGSAAVSREYFLTDSVGEFLLRRADKFRHLLGGDSVVREENIGVFRLGGGGGLYALRLVEIHQELLHQGFGHFVPGDGCHAVGGDTAVPGSSHVGGPGADVAHHDIYEPQLLRDYRVDGGDRLQSEPGGFQSGEIDGGAQALHHIRRKECRNDFGHKGITPVPLGLADLVSVQFQGDNAVTHAVERCGAVFFGERLLGGADCLQFRFPDIRSGDHAL